MQHPVTFNLRQHPKRDGYPVSTAICKVKLAVPGYQSLRDLEMTKWSFQCILSHFMLYLSGIL